MLSCKLAACVKMKQDEVTKSRFMYKHTVKLGVTTVSHDANGLIVHTGVWCDNCTMLHTLMFVCEEHMVGSSVGRVPMQ